MTGLGSRALCILVTLTLLATAAPVQRVVRATTCSDVHIVWARGTGASLDDQEGERFLEDLKERIAPPVSASDYRLGDPGFGDYSYPATGNPAELLFYRGFGVLGYNDSVKIGVREFEAYIEDRSAECPDEVYVVAGYSQGAHVIGNGLDRIGEEVRDRIAFVALFGDPVRNNDWFFNAWPLESHPPACSGNPRPWIRGTAPCTSSGGFFGPRFPYVPEDIELRVGSWCRAGDSACEGSLRLDWATHHGSYFNEGADSFHASREAAQALAQFLPHYEAAFDTSWHQFATGTGGADLAIVFDTTGSMFWHIADAKANATALAEAWLTSLPNGRVALVQYRDHGDAFVARLELELTNDVAAFQAAVDGLVAQGGGDTPEAVYSGMMAALNELDWRTGATKALVVIADAPGKDPEPVTGYTQADVVNRALEIDPVALYAVNVANWNVVTNFFTPLAEQTAGAVFELQPGQSLSDALFEVLDTVSLSPVAYLPGPYFAETGTPITFRAYPAFDPDGELVSYEWDFDGDGTVDQTTNAPEVHYTYPGEFHGLAVLRVVSSDGGTALASAEVSVDSVGLADLFPLAPSSANAAVTGPGEVTVTWTPAGDDRADGYRVFFADGTLAGHVFASDPHSLTMDQLDLSGPVSFFVVSSNEHGLSAAVSADLAALPASNYAADAFSRSVTSTWGSADVGGAYTLQGTAANYSVADGVGRISVPSAGITRSAILTDVSERDLDISFRVKTDKAAAGGGYFVYAVARRNGNNEYRPRITLNANGSVSAHAGVLLNNSESGIGSAVTVAGLSHTADSFIWLRAQVEGQSPTTIRVKAWAHGQAEPAEWHYTGTNSASALQTAGAVGLRTYLGSQVSNAPVAFSFDDYLVAAPGPPPPAPSANFDWSQPAGRTVDFTDTSTGSPTTWSWDFGDSTTSTQQNPTKTYFAAGDYSVSLTATNAAGSTSKTLLVSVEELAPPVLAADQFDRTVSSGWGSADTGGAYTIQGTAANYTVGAREGNIVVPNAGITRSAILGSVSARDIDVVFQVKTDKAAAGGAYFVYAVTRRNGNNEYRPRLTLNANGTVSVHAGVVINNSESSIGSPVTVAGLSHTPGGFIYLRAEVTGANPTTIRVKAWSNHQYERDDWQYTGTNSASELQTAGAVGLRTYVGSQVSNAPVTFSFADYEVVGFE